MSSHLHEYHRLRWTVLAICLLAWMALALPAGSGAPVFCGAAATGPGGGGLAGADWLAVAQGWGLMLVAMVGPMLIPPLYFVYLGSFSRLRLRLMALCAAGFAAVWAIAATLLAIVALLLPAWLAAPWAPVLVVGALALVWQASPWKKAFLNRCHVHRPLAAFGFAAHRDAAREGVEHGLWCVGSCWLNMLWPMLLPAGHLVGMMAAALLMYCERLDPGAVPRWRLRGFRTAFWYAVWIWRRARRRAAENAPPHTPQPA